MIELCFSILFALLESGHVDTLGVNQQTTH